MKAGLLALAMAAVPAAAAGLTVEVTLDPAEVTVGDHVAAILEVTVPPEGLAAPPRFPVWAKAWGEAEIVRAEAPVESRAPGGGTVWRQRLVLQVLRPGALRLPRVEVALPGEQSTAQAATPEGLAVQVRSVLPPGSLAAKLKPEPAEALRQLPLGAPFLWTLGIGSALCLIAGGAALRRPRHTSAAPARRELPPFEELAADLARLATAEPLDAHTRLSWALRRYLGRVLPFAAVHSTTSQIQAQLLSRRLPGPLVRRTVELLRACDLVKFARAEVGGAETAARIAAAGEVARGFEACFSPSADREEAA